MKRLSISVAIACDRAPGNFQRAMTIRSVLETFGLQVYFYQLLQKQNVIDFLAGDYPDCDYVIWYCYGCQNTSGEEQINFEAVHQEDNDYACKSGWKQTTISLTSSNLSQYIRNPKGTLICGSTSGEQWAETFLELGFKAYIAPTKAELSCNSYTLFLTGFFYHLLLHTLDYTEQRFTPQEAVVEAAAMDKHYQGGTKLFHYYQ